MSLTHMIDNTPVISPELRQSEHDLKRDIYKLQHPEAEHLASPARAKKMSDKSDKCTLPFFGTYGEVKVQGWVNSIHKATWEEGKEPVITGKESHPKKIPKELAKYYKMLLDKKPTNEKTKASKDKILTKMALKRIQDESAKVMDRAVTKEEIQEIMDDLPLRKQAGPNRIPNGVYRCMSKDFAPHLADILNQVMNGETELPPDMLEGDITVLYSPVPQGCSVFVTVCRRCFWAL